MANKLGGRGGFGREWRRSEEVEREAGPAQRWRRSCAVLRGDGSGAACEEREERGGVEDRGWSLRARFLGFQLLLYGRSANRAIRLEMDG